ncbi:hypothetical protein [Rhodopseudomonas sp. B29]|uniref:hypothetical protein n=1 Tax=Rhodopseudomonas sp. B29 TaxID=95607 RepID=UPI0018FFDA82|nr:hypothetical protein [Rhodopseudomonas sp. B29]
MPVTERRSSTSPPALRIARASALESLCEPNGAVPEATKETVKSEEAEGLSTVLNLQRVGTQRYFDTAGFPGRTLGLDDDKTKPAGN